MPFTHCFWRRCISLALVAALPFVQAGSDPIISPLPHFNLAKDLGPAPQADQSSEPRYLTAKELRRYPDYDKTISSLKPHHRGWAPVGHGRGGPWDLHWEIHGHGPKHIIWIMGVGSTLVNWQFQTEDFGHKHAKEYTSLVFDNRGIGRSDAPLTYYSTSSMAQDVVELLDHVGWTHAREVHVVGMSLGGLIAQELALQIPHRIASLTLLSAASRVRFLQRGPGDALMRIPPMKDRLESKEGFETAAFCGCVFSKGWESQPDKVLSFPTNRDRESALYLKQHEVPSHFTHGGFFCQAVAGFCHNKPRNSLQRLGDLVGRARIQVIRGGQDAMVPAKASAELADALSSQPDEIQVKTIPMAGHGLPVEAREELFQLVEELVDKTQPVTGFGDLPALTHHGIKKSAAKGGTEKDGGALPALQSGRQGSFQKEYH